MPFDFGFPNDVAPQNKHGVGIARSPGTITEGTKGRNHGFRPFAHVRVHKEDNAEEGQPKNAANAPSAGQGLRSDEMVIMAVSFNVRLSMRSSRFLILRFRELFY